MFSNPVNFQIQMLIKMDNFFWKSYEDAHQFQLHDSYFIKASSLKIIRLVQLFIHSLIPLYYIFSLRILNSIKYLTVIGMYLNFIYFILITYATIFPLKNPSSHRFFKRLTIVIYEVTFSMQFTITFFFWFCLYPVYDTTKIFPDWLAFFVVGVYMHSFCWLGLWIDKFFNTIHFDKKHFLFLVVVMSSYAGFTYIYKMVYETNIYPVIKWDVDSAGYMILAVVFTVAHFYFGLWVSNYKSKNYTVHGKEEGKKKE